MEEHEWIGQACFRLVDYRTTRPKPGEKFFIRTAQSAPKYPEWRERPAHWPSRFTLTPTVTRVSTLEYGGRFQEVEKFEKAFGERWAYAGFLTVYHPEGWCRHAGEGQSAYDINGTSR